MSPLLHAARAFGVELILAVALGVAIGVTAVLLILGRRRAHRLRHLASRAAGLGRGAPVDLGTPHQGRDEIAALARALHAAEARLQEERATREKFLARALEEVKRPLSLLSTSLDLALRRRPEVPELTAAVRDAQSESERIVRLATRVAQLQSVAGAVRRSPVDLAYVVRSVWQLAQGAAESKGVRLLLDAKGPAPVAGDAALLTQALDELVSNALTASRYGQAITLGVERAGAAFRATVRDEGAGIAPERRLACFEPFNRGPNGWSPAGLGLALAREIARGHGGSLTLGDVERGALLVLELPAAS
jgi:signal transduction histidine kinase